MSDSRTAFTRSLFDTELPDEWALVSAGDVISTTEYGLSEPSDERGNVRIVGMKDIDGGLVRFDSLATVNGGSDGWPRLELKKGDILLNRTNSPDLVGKVGIVSKDTNVVFASYLVRIRADRSLVDPQYLNDWLNCTIAQRALKRLSTRGVSQANINPTEFRKHCPVPLPPMDEQRKISAALSAWTDAIELLTPLIKLRRRQYLGLRNRMVDWFGESQARLGSFVKPISRVVEKPTASYRALSIRSHGKGTFERLVEDPDSVSMDKLYIAKADDLIVNITFAWEGALAFVPEEHDGCLVSHRFPTFVILDDVADPRYLRHALRMPRFTYLLSVISPGGAGRNRVLSKRDLLDLKVPLPSLREQRNIARMLDDAERACFAEIEYREALHAQRRGLMQKLFTGEWRVLETETMKTIR